MFFFFSFFLLCFCLFFFFFLSSRRRHTRCLSDWSSDVCSSDLLRVTLLASSVTRRKMPGVLHGHDARSSVPSAPPVPAGASLPDWPRRSSLLRRQARSEERRVGKERGWLGRQAC